MKRLIPLLFLHFGLGSGVAQPVPDPGTVVLPEAPSEIVVEDPFAPVPLGKFIDGIMAAQFESFHLAGAVVVIVKDGSVLLRKGYGQADVEAGVPVDPERTLFRIASVSKLFTWTTVMQMAERGQIDLDRDVNTYLQRFELPSTFSRPVTLKDLMSHTGGFEDRIIGLLPRTKGGAGSLERLLSERMPARIRPPGEVPAYSNFGTALAGLVIQDVAGVTWERIVRDNLLDPLGMSQTRLGGEDDGILDPASSKGYAFRDGRLAAMPFEQVAGAPAGGVSTSAGDIAKFMLLHLQKGIYGGRSVLREETAVKMQSLLFSLGPQACGMAHGFFVWNRNGKRLVGHLGDLSEFHSALWLIPDEGLGFFVSYNSEDGKIARDGFQTALLDHWFPAGHDAVRSPGGFDRRAVELAGEYLPTRRPYTTLDKFSELVGHLRVETVAAGTLRSSSLLGKVQRWVETEPYVFKEEGGNETLVFRVGPGRPLACFGNVPMHFEKARWFETTSFHLLIFGIAQLIFISTLAFPILRWMMVRRSDRMLGRQDPGHPRARFLAGVVSALNLGFVVGAVWVLRNPLVLLEQVPAALPYLLVLPLLSGFLTVVTLIVALFAWRGGYWNFFARLHYSLVGFAALVFLWQLNYWNFLGWRF